MSQFFSFPTKPTALQLADSIAESLERINTPALRQLLTELREAVLTRKAPITYTVDLLNSMGNVALLFTQREILPEVSTPVFRNKDLIVEGIRAVVTSVEEQLPLKVVLPLKGFADAVCERSTLKRDFYLAAYVLTASLAEKLNSLHGAAAANPVVVEVLDDEDDAAIDEIVAGVYSMTLI